MAPSIDDGQWAELIKRRLARLGFDYPWPPERLTDAMRAVEQALAKTDCPRPPPIPPARREVTREELHQADPPWSRRRDVGSWRSVRDLLASLKGLRGSGSS